MRAFLFQRHRRATIVALVGSIAVVLSAALVVQHQVQPQAPTMAALVRFQSRSPVWRGIRPTRPGHIPAYTAADVRAWFAAHHGAAPIWSRVPATIVSIHFMTATQASQVIASQLVYGGDAAVPDVVGPNDLVCVVTLTGHFPGSDPGGSGPAIPRLPGTPVPPPYYTKLVAIFDGKNGVFLTGMYEP